jgi:hypothetical protein
MDPKALKEKMNKLITERGGIDKLTDEDWAGLTPATGGEADQAGFIAKIKALFSTSENPPKSDSGISADAIAQAIAQSMAPIMSKLNELETNQTTIATTQKAIVDGQKSQEELALISKVKSTIQTLIAEGKIATEEGKFGEKPEEHGKYTAALLRDYDFMSAELSSRPAKKYDNTATPATGDKTADKNAPYKPTTPELNGVGSVYAQYAEQAVNN